LVTAKIGPFFRKYECGDPDDLLRIPPFIWTSKPLKRIYVMLSAAKHLLFLIEKNNLGI